MRAGPLAAPGRYAFRLTVGDRQYTQAFDVVKDPTIPAPDADLVASTAAQIRVRDALNTTVDMINRLEIMRKQIEDQLTAQRGKADLERALRELDRKMMDVELQLLSRTELHSDDKWYVEAYKIYLNLVWLNGEVGTGASDMAGGADHRPTDASLQFLAQLETDLARARADFTAVVEREVPAFNRTMAGRLPAITDQPPRRTT
jgi:hypothetical protein